MQIKIYNENGNIRITKITANGLEQTIVNSLHNAGEVEVDAEVAYLCIKAEKDSILIEF